MVKPFACGADPFAVDMHVEQIGATLDIRPFGARERFLDFGGVADHLAFHAIAHGRLGEIDVRAAVVAGVILACFELLSSDTAPDAVALVIVASVVYDDVGDRRFVAGLAP